MKQDLQQPPNEFAKVLVAPFTWLGRHLLLTVMISLIVVSVGYLWLAAPRTTTMSQAVIPTSKFERTPFALTPSITPSKSSASNPSSQWITAATFTGNGVKKTTAFTAPKNWRIVESCDLSSHNNTAYDIIIHANMVNNTLLANSIETTCNKNNTHSFAVMHQAGTIYLNIISEGNWTVQVQFPK